MFIMYATLGGLIIKSVPRPLSLGSHLYVAHSKSSQLMESARNVRFVGRHKYWKKYDGPAMLRILLRFNERSVHAAQAGNR